MKLHGISPSPSASEDERESESESPIQVANIHENGGRVYLQFFVSILILRTLYCGTIKLIL